MNGSVTSTAHCSEPFTFAGMSYRFGDCPTIFRSCTGLTFATPVVALISRPVSVTSNRLPPISWPYVTVFGGSLFTVTTASVTVN